MFTTASLVSLAPVGRRAVTAATRSFMSGGPSGLGDLGIVPLIAAGVSAGASAYGSFVQADAAADVAIATAEAQARALEAPFRYEYKTQKKAIAAGRLQMAFDAVSGTMVPKTKDYTGLYIAGGLGFLILVGGFFLMKGVR